MIGCKFYSENNENDENNDLGESYKNLLTWMTGSRWLNENYYLDEHDKKLLSGMT